MNTSEADRIKVLIQDGRDNTLENRYHVMDSRELPRKPWVSSLVHFGSRVKRSWMCRYAVSLHWARFDSWIVTELRSFRNVLFLCTLPSRYRTSHMIYHIQRFFRSGTAFTSICFHLYTENANSTTEWCGSHAFCNGLSSYILFHFEIQI